MDLPGGIRSLRRSSGTEVGAADMRIQTAALMLERFLSEGSTRSQEGVELLRAQRVAMQQIDG